MLVIESRPLKAPLNSKLFQVEGDSTKAKNVTTADTLMDLLRNSFPPNIIQATMQQYKTEIIYPGEENVSRLFFVCTSLVVMNLIWACLEMQFF